MENGRIGRIAAANIRRYREAHDLSYAEVARQLDDLGRPIPPISLRHLERGARRIDIDDLFTLAQVLGVSPMALITPASPKLGDPAAIAVEFLTGTTTGPDDDEEEAE